MKKFYLKTLLAALGMCMGVSAWADDVALDPVGVFTWTNAPAITYDPAATSWIINQGGVSGGRIGRYAGPYAIVKFDASTILDGKTLLTARLDFDITAGAYNSSINIAQMSSATFNPATVTTETFDASAAQFQDGDWSTKNATVHFSYDVKDRVSAANVLAFAIYTNTGREQTLKNVKLNLQYSDEEVAQYSYSLKAVMASGTEIKTLASGEEYETNTVKAYFPYMFVNEGTLYTTTATPYGVTFDKDNTTSEVTYTEASSDIVVYMEGEAASANTGENDAYSNGKSGYSAGNRTTALASLSAGKYRATIYLVGNPNRSIVLRNTANTDVTTNTIVSLPITKTSAAGVYTSDEFILLEETGIGFSGYTSGEKTNQSADIDYIYIQKTGEASVPFTVSSAGWATLYTPYALNFAETGLTAYTATLEGDVVTLAEVSNVPANTGVVLKAAAGNYEIPVIASSETLQGSLTGNAAEATAYNAEDGYTYYILALVDGGKKVQFVPATSGSIAAGKAFLKVSDTVGAKGRVLGVRFEGEATGIDAVEAEAAQEGVYYNLNGQRIAAPEKGIYIVNGKKVFIR